MYGHISRRTRKCWLISMAVLIVVCFSISSRYLFGVYFYYLFILQYCCESNCTEAVAKEVEVGVMMC
jgi:hypothetical protein